MSALAQRYTPAIKRLLVSVSSILIATAALTEPGTAQIPDSLSSLTRVSLLTELPGEPIYAAFAHSALRFRDEGTGVDMVFNFGTFDPTAPYFVPRFMYGRMDYFLSVYGTRGLMSAAAEENRSIIEQVLMLSPEESSTLYQRLREQAKPENRVYRYDFLKENCSTILLDLLRDVNDDIRFDTSGVEPISYRELLQPYIEHRPFWDLGIDLVLGAQVDETAWYFDRDFLPIELKRTLDDAYLTRPDSARTRIPLVSRTDTLFWVGEGYSQTKAFPWLAVFAWLSVIAGIASGEMRKRSRPQETFRTDRWFFGILGILGLFLTFMWFGTLHYVTDYNWNILWALPTHLVVTVGWHKLTAGWIGRYFRANAMIVGILVVIQFFGPQQLHAAFLPLAVFIAWRSWCVANAVEASDN